MAKAKTSRLTFILLFSVAGTILIVVLYFLLGRPALRYSENMRKKFLSYQAKLQEGEDLIRSLPNPQQSLDNIRRKNAEFRETSGAGKQLPKIIQILGQSASGRQINIISIRPREDLKTGIENLPAGVTKLFFEITFSGSYQEIAEYIKVLSGLPGGFTVETLTIERQERDPPKGGQRSGLLSASLVVSTYMVEDLK
jgi:Tfp pilus assembly protein PilO